VRQVKWQDDSGNWHFGIVTGEKHDGIKAAKGNVFVEHAILPELYEIEANKLTEIPYGDYPVKDFRTGEITEGGTEFDHYVNRCWLEARKLSKTVGSGLKKNKLFYLPVADGRAWYIVTKVNPKTCDVEWRGFGPDRWLDRVLGWGGRFERSRIEPIVEGVDTLEKIFSK